MNSPLILLRHDVDRLPQNALKTAQLEHSLGIHGSYYFRIVPESFDEKVIREVAALGHEIGYHYEDMDLAGKEIAGRPSGLGRLLRRCAPRNDPFFSDGLYSTAIRLFEEHLERLRRLVPVVTVCMHGSPRSGYDSRDLWKKYDYRDFGIIGEPYFDIDFSKVLYLTDTGRRWDGAKVSVRDKVQGPGNNSQQVKTPRTWHSTFDIIRAAEAGALPAKIMITVHPQRWSDRPGPWVKELVWQNVKNVVKRILVLKQR